VRAVRECVEAALGEAGLPPDTRFRAACFGMSGGPADKRAILAEILPADILEVTDDAVIALAGAMAGGEGVIVIAGTGSIAFGRNAAGRSARAGGWGYVFGDEGSAFDIARQSLRASLRAEEGWGPPTSLGAMLLRETGARDVNGVLHLFYTPEWPRSRVAKLAPAVGQVAEAGDAVAREVLEGRAREMADFARSIARRLWKPGESVRVAHIGGVFASRLLFDKYRAEIARNGYVSIAPLAGPAAGALIEAYRAAGVTPDLGKLLSSEF
jgi:N-acetylglucosamine kinase-like BadF-type ATPase